MTDRYNDAVRLATWAKLFDTGNAKELDDITEQDMDAWWVASLK